jgi:hypothetical protein
MKTTGSCGGRYCSKPTADRRSRPTGKICLMSQSLSPTKAGLLVPRSHNRVSFSISGPGEIVRGG